MFIDDLKNDFYNVILGKRVLLLVSFDVDALCACKILQYLLQCDQIVYSLIPVAGVHDMKLAFEEHSEQVKHVVFINCGGTVNLIEELQPEDDVVFFIIDSHRPIDVYNIYNAERIRLLMHLSDDESVPALEDIYQEDDESEKEIDDSDDDDEHLGRAAKRQKLQESVLERRIERRRWEENREKILFEYMQFSYYGNSVAMQFFDLAWKMSKDNNDLLWWAAIGLTDQLIHHKIEQSKFIIQAGELQGHVSRLNRRNDDVNSSTSIHCMKLSFEKELQLSLYRHWSLYESLKHTKYTACKFRLWTLKGEKRLLEFLAELGLPLAQCKQRFASMDMFLRNNFRTWIEDKTEKYGLEHLVNGSFLAHFGFKHHFCASDIVYAISGLLESGDKNKTTKDNFLDALDSLSRSNLESLEYGISLAKKQLKAILHQVQTFLDLNQVISAGPFLYAVISESAPGSGLFSHPICLASLAHYLLHAHVTVSKNRKSRNLPLVLAAPSTEGKSLVIGIPPLSEESPKNFFGQAFIQASAAARTQINDSFFDSHVIEMETEENSKFFDALISLLN